MFRSLKNHDSVKLKKVIEFVREERKRMNVREEDLDVDPRWEPSCIAFGEFNNLLYCQLIYTKEGYANWGELNGEEILDGLIEFITKIKNGRRCSYVGDMQPEIGQRLPDSS